MAILGTGLVASVPGLADIVNETRPLVRESVDKVSSRIRNTSAKSRAQVIEASHAVIVVHSFYSAAFREMPDLTRAAKVSRKEKLALAEAARVDNRQAGKSSLQVDITDQPVPCPSFDISLTDNAAQHLQPFFFRLSENWLELLAGLELTAKEAGEYNHAEIVKQLSESAMAEYYDNVVRLAVDAPEFSIWLAMSDRGALRNELRHAWTRVTEEIERGARSLQALEELLAKVGATSAMAAGGLGADLQKVNRAALERPILDIQEPGLDVPSIAFGYIGSRFRFAKFDENCNPSEDAWWEGRDAHSNFALWMAAYCLSDESATAPLLVLGMPGSGKSLLTRVLAARLPGSKFAVARVSLRDVVAVADLHQQIESALETAVHAKYTWQQFCTDHNGISKLVILDGLDELIQASASDLSHQDYLLKVADFQRTEAALGRQVRIIVTSRTVMASRVTIPTGSTIVRLEQFSDSNIQEWLKCWKELTGNIGNARLQELGPEHFSLQGGLGRQPLLLALMLVHYHSEGRPSAPRQTTVTRFFGELVDGFLRREAGRNGPLSSGSSSNAELRRLNLEASAFAMFSRRVQVLAEHTLKSDIGKLLGEQERLGITDLVQGFYFLQRNTARLSNGERRSYEFLHATIGEYLAAAYVFRRLMAVAEERSKSAAANDDLSVLNEVDLVFADCVFAVRDTVLNHLVGMLRDQPLLPQVRSILIDRIKRLDVTYTVSTESRIPGVPTLRRISTILANCLVLLGVLDFDEPVSLRECFSQNALGAWRTMAAPMLFALDRDELGALVDTIVLDTASLHIMRNVQPETGHLENRVRLLVGDEMGAATARLLDTLTGSYVPKSPREILVIEYLLAPDALFKYGDEDPQMGWLALLDLLATYSEDQASQLVNALSSVLASRVHRVPYILVAALSVLLAGSSALPSGYLPALLEKSSRHDARATNEAFLSDYNTLNQLLPHTRSALAHACRHDLDQRRQPGALSQVQRAQSIVRLALGSDIGKHVAPASVYDLREAAMDADLAPTLEMSSASVGRIVEQVITGERTRPSICAEYKLSEVTLEEWIRAFLQGGHRSMRPARWTPS